jgi:hypothetical protein
MLVGSAVASTKATAGRTGMVTGASWDNSNDAAVYHVRCLNGDMIELTHAETVEATRSFSGSAAAATTVGGSGKVKATSKRYSNSACEKGAGGNRCARARHRGDYDRRRPNRQGPKSRAAPHATTAEEGDP